MDLEKELQRGSEAQQLLNNPIFREVMEEMRSDLRRVTLSTPTTETDKVLDAVRNEQVFESIEMKIIGKIQSGRMAQMQMEAEAKMKDPKFQR